MKLKKSRRPLTLLEVVIGFALTAILLTFLFSSFRHMADLGMRVQKGREAVHARALVQLRLSQLFECLIQQDKKVSFYTDEHPESTTGALYFSFDNRLDHDPKFCSEMQGILFLNGKKQLCLSIGSNEHERKEILYTGASQLSFQFFNSKNKEWQANWDKEEIPSVIRFKIDNGIDFTFLVGEDL